MEEVNAALCGALGALAVPVLGHIDGLLAVPVPPSDRSATRFRAAPRRFSKRSARAACRWLRRSRSARSTSTPTTPPEHSRSGSARRSLVFLTDVAGLYIDDEIVDAIGVVDARRMLAEGAFDGGIVPKLRAAALAAASGITATIGRTAVVA